MIVPGLALLAGAISSTASIRFESPLLSNAAVRPAMVAVADLNGDGILDLASCGDKKVAVSIGRGDGTYSTHRDFDSTPLPYPLAAHAIVAADFTGDGNIDVAVAHRGTTGFNDTTLVLLHGDGAGGFSTLALVPSGGFASTSQALATADFDSDGNADLAYATSGGIGILLGHGDGNFDAYVRHPVFFNSLRVIRVVDVNGNGTLDLVCVDDIYARNGNVLIVPGNGDGTFGAAQTLPVGFEPKDVVVADFDADSNLDLAVATNHVEIRRGLGGGLFGAASTIPLGGTVNALAAADMDGDAIVDLECSVWIGSDSYFRPRIAYLRGNGDATFQTPRLHGVSGNPKNLHVLDLNDDGAKDLAFVNYPSRAGSEEIAGGIGVMLSGSPGALARTRRFARAAGRIELAEVSGDGVLDVIAGGSYNPLYVIPGDGSAGFHGTPLDTLTGNSGPISNFILADFDGNGTRDLALGHTITNGTLEVFSNDGAGHFTSTSNLTVGGQFIQFVAAGDLNGDGKADLAASLSNRDVAVFLAGASGGFAPVVNYPGGTAGQVAVVDFNGDGKCDVLTEGGLLRGTGTGTLGVLQPIAFPATGLTVALLDQDSRPDVIQYGNTRETSSTVFVSRNNGSGGVLPSERYAANFAISDLKTGDIDNDGSPDLACVSQDGSATVLRNTGAGRFSYATHYGVPYPASGIAMGDVDGDGWIDLLATNRSPSVRPESTMVLLNRQYPSTAVGPSVGTPAREIEFLRAWPNPSRGRFQLAFQVAKAGRASIDLFDIGGRRRVHRELGLMAPGRHQIELGTDRTLPPGIYLARLDQGGRRVVKRVMIVR